jgi:hypothetical protein
MKATAQTSFLQTVILTPSRDHTRHSPGGQAVARSTNRSIIGTFRDPALEQEKNARKTLATKQGNFNAHPTRRTLGAKDSGQRSPKSRKVVDCSRDLGIRSIIRRLEKS